MPDLGDGWLLLAIVAVIALVVGLVVAWLEGPDES